MLYLHKFGILASVILVILGKNANAIGDERTFLTLHPPSEVTGSFECRPQHIGAPSFPILPGLTKELKWAEPHDLCEDPSAAEQQTYHSKIVFIERGDCTFFDKVRRAETFGAKAAVIVNNVYTPEFVTMNLYPFFNITTGHTISKFRVDIPVCGLRLKDGNKIKGAIHDAKEAVTGTINDGQTELLHASHIGSGTQMEIFIDGSKIESFSQNPATMIYDTYGVVGVHAVSSETVPGKAGFAVHVSDGFSSNGAFLCTSNKPAEDWTALRFRPDQSWSPATTYSTPPTPDGFAPALYIWSTGSNTADGEIWCRGYRYLSSIKVDGYQYFYSKTPMSWQDAEKFCSSKAFEDSHDAHLASIRSLEENALLHSLLPPDSDLDKGAWIGLNDIEEENEFVWSDGSRVEFVNWREGEPNNRNDEEDCVQMDKYGFWNDLRCSGQHELPALCQRKVGKTEDQDTPEEESAYGAPQCLFYWDEGEGSGSFFHKSTILGDTADDLCHDNSDDNSCCSTNYVNNVLHDKFNLFKTKITDKKCMKAIKESICVQCGSNQMEYTHTDSKTPGLNVAICEDTCVTIYEWCKDDPFVSTVIKSSKHLCDFIEKFAAQEDLQGIHVQTVKSDSNMCFRYDNLPPIVSKYSPSNYTQVNGKLNRILIQFNEQVQIGEGSATIYRLDEKDGKVSEVPVHTIELSKPELISYQKAVWSEDTLNIALGSPTEVSCIFQGKNDYKIVFDDMAVMDMAGNQWFGNKGEGFQWIVKGDGKNCKHSHGSHGGSLVVVVLLVGALAGAGFLYYKRRVGDNSSYGIVTEGVDGVVQEGDIIKTATGEHQVRLVPVYNPAEGNTGNNDGEKEGILTQV